jgi:hypothetical protein
MKVLRSIVLWWRGSADPSGRAEAERIRACIDLDRAETFFAAGQTTKAGG